jgi:hypothetical protein
MKRKVKLFNVDFFKVLSGYFLRGIVNFYLLKTKTKVIVTFHVMFLF